MTVWRSQEVVRPESVGADAQALDKLAQVFTDAMDSREHCDGAQVAVYKNGERVLYMGGGLARIQEEQPVEENTLFTIFSSTKGWATLVMHKLHEAGHFEYDDTIASVWPAFGEARNHDKITFRHLLGHRGGFPLGPGWLSPAQWNDSADVRRAMEEFDLWWEPGEKNGYHAINYGLMVNELVQMLDGRNCGEYLYDEVFTPLGLDDCYLGLPDSEDDRVAFCFESPEARGGMAMLAGPLGSDKPTEGGIAGALAAGPGGMPRLGENAVDTEAMKDFTDASKPFLFNRPDTWRMVLPFGGGLATADALAHYYAVLSLGGECNGVRVIHEDTLEQSLTPTNKPGEKDAVIQFPLRWAHGWMIGMMYGPGATDRTFGHAGMGGQQGFADLDRTMSFAFVNTGGKTDMMRFMMFGQQLQGLALKACS